MMQGEKSIKVLLIEDNPSDSKLLCKALSESSHIFDVTSVSLLEDAVRHLESKSLDVIILDLFLPDSEGLETLEKILRVSRNIPILILTGMESEALGVEAIRQGAEEYLLKNEITDKSISRSISLAMERNRTRTENHDFLNFSQFKVGDLEVDLVKQTVVFEKPDQRDEISLTPIEFKILVLLGRNPGIILPRSKIVAEVWGSTPALNQSISVRTLDKHVSALKKKCSPALNNIESVYGVGYLLEIHHLSKQKIS